MNNPYIVALKTAAVGALLAGATAAIDATAQLASTGVIDPKQLRQIALAGFLAGVAGYLKTSPLQKKQ